MKPKENDPALHTALEEYRRFVLLRDVLPRTANAYIAAVRLLSQHIAAHPTTLTEYHVRHYFHFLRQEKRYSPGSMNQARVAIRTYFHGFLKISPDWEVFSDIKVHHRPQLPNVLSREDVRTLLSSFESDRFRTYFSLIYACGLRRLEALAIGVGDIDAAAGRLHIRNGKGGKPRHVPISPEMIDQLRNWWKWHRNPTLLFPSCVRRWRNRECPLGTEQGLLDFEERPHWRTCLVRHPDNEAIARREAMHTSTEHMGINTVQEAMRRCVDRCGFTQKITIHTLRHCYATHLLEDGVSIRHISAYLGHASLHQTLVYFHLTEAGDKSAREALSNLHRTVINPTPPPASRRSYLPAG